MNHYIEIIDTCIKEGLILQGQLQSLQDEKKRIVDKVEEAKIWLQKQPDYLNFLKQLQEILHQKNIGAFSELLSYFVKDVLQKDTKTINLELYTYHNLPALRIEALNNGQPESIIEGNGGSIANIVSTGLRLIALSRMQQRQFIVLDEPDCWLQPEHISLFAKIIGEISQKLRIQTIIISHHHWSYFKDYGRVIELKVGDTKLETEIIHDTPFSSDNIDYIRKITLRTFMSHYNTVYDLHPFLTCIVGNNDIGKSVLATALKAVSYGDSSDSYITHFENEAQVVIELADSKILWQRFRNTDQDNPQKVKYTLLKDNQNPISEFNSYEAPLFIKNELKISTVEEIDIHIGNQKQPVFLLSSDVKPQERAKILSLGKESLTIQKIMETIKSKTKSYKSTIKDGESRYGVVENLLNVLSTIPELVENAEKLKTSFFILSSQSDKIKDISNLIHNLDLATKAASIPKINFDIKIPSLKDLTELNKLIIDFNFEKNISNINKINYTQNNSFNIKNTEELSNLIVNLELLEKLSSITLIDIPKFKFSLDDNNINSLSEIINSLENNMIELNNLNTNKKNVLSWRLKIDTQINEFLETNKFCPTCNQTLSINHFNGDNHA